MGKLHLKAPYLGNIAKNGDLSYGLYIYHFPILQATATLKLTNSPVLAFAIGSMLAFGAAWHFLRNAGYMLRHLTCGIGERMAVALFGMHRRSQLQCYHYLMRVLDSVTERA